MPDDKITPADFAASLKEKYPQYKDMPDGVLVSNVLAKYPQYRAKLNLGPVAQPEGESGLGRFAKTAWDFGPPGLVGQVSKSALSLTGLPDIARILTGGKEEPEDERMKTVRGLNPIPGTEQLQEAAKFYSGLMPTPTLMGAKGTITEPGMGKALAGIVPEVGGALTGLALDEIIFRHGPAIAKKAAPLVTKGAGKALTAVGKGVEAHPYIAGGPAGAVVAGKTIGHPYVGYIAGAAAARPIGRWMQRMGEKLAGAFPGQVNRFGAVPGTEAFKVQASAVFEKGSPALTAGEQAAQKLLSEGSRESRQKAGGIMLREPPRIKPEYATKASGLTIEMKPPALRAKLAEIQSSHAIPIMNEYADKRGVEISGRNVAQILEGAKDAEWIDHQVKYVSPIADKTVDLAGIGTEIGKAFEGITSTQNPELAAALSATKKHYAKFKSISVGALADRVTEINKALRLSQTTAIRSVMKAERNALLPELYGAFNEYLPPELFDHAIISRRRYGALSEISTYIDKIDGEARTNPKGWDMPSRFDKQTTRDNIIKEIFAHKPGAGPQYPPITRSAARARALDKQMGITPEIKAKFESRVAPPIASTPAKTPVAPAKAATAAKLPKTLTDDQIMTVLTEGDPAKFHLLKGKGLNATHLDRAVQAISDTVTSTHSPTTIEDMTDRLLALQKLKPELTGNPELARAIANEAKATKTAAGRKAALRGEAAAQQEKQLGGGKRIKKVEGD